MKLPTDMAGITEDLHVIANKIQDKHPIWADHLRGLANNLKAIRAPKSKNMHLKCFKCHNLTGLCIDPDTLNFYCFSCGLKGSGWLALSNAYTTRNRRATAKPKLKKDSEDDPLLQVIHPDETKQVDYLKVIAFVVHLLWSSLASKDLFELLEKMGEPWEDDCDGLTFTASNKVPPFAQEIVDKYLLKMGCPTSCCEETPCTSCKATPGCKDPCTECGCSCEDKTIEASLLAERITELERETNE